MLNDDMGFSGLGCRGGPWRYNHFSNGEEIG
jgi:hypothetical protein